MGARPSSESTNERVDRVSNARPSCSSSRATRRLTVDFGTGFGLRTILLGYPVRFDYAWPFDGRQFGKRQFYFSIGLDF